MAQDFYKIVEVANEATYTALIPKDINTFYYIVNTKKIFLGENQFAVDVEFVDTALPSTGIINKLYVVKGGASKGLYYWNDDEFEALLSASTVTVDGIQTLTNKTIDADNNTLSNITTANFKSTALDKDLTTGVKTDTTIATSKAIVDYVSAITGSVFDLRGTVNIASPGTTMNGAKKGYTWIIQNSAVYLTVDFNPNDLIVFVKNITGAPVAGDFVKLDNTESPDIIRKIASAAVGEIVTFTADGNIQKSNTTISDAEPVTTSTDATVPTSKAVFTAVNKKASKPASPINNNLVKTDANGNLVDAGILSTNVVTLTAAQTLTNKTIAAGNNTITGLKTTNFDSSVLKTAVDSTATDAELLTAKAVYNALKITRI